MTETGGSYRENPEPRPQPGESLDQGPIRKGISRLANWISPDLSPEMKKTADDILHREHPMFEPGSNEVIVEQYRGTRKTDPYARIRSLDFRAGIEASYLLRQDKQTGEMEIKPEGGMPEYPLPGFYPIDPKERF
jgi:hypothetical protein